MPEIVELGKNKAMFATDIAWKTIRQRKKDYEKGIKSSINFVEVPQQS